MEADLRVAFILNGSSGSCDPSVASEAAARAAAANGAVASIHVLDTGTDVNALVKSALMDGARIVVAGGGDGTVSAVAAALAGSDVPLGVLPLGTLNHFAKDLEIPLGLENALANIFEGAPQRVDVGEVNGRVFINNSGVGLYPHIVQSREAIRKHGYPKWLALLRASIRKLRAYSMVRVSLTTREGRRLDRSTPFLFVGNNRFEIAGLKAGTRKRLDTGHLWVCLAPEAGRLELAVLATLALFGRLRERDLVAFEASALNVATRRRRQHVSLDGEVCLLETPLEYRARPKSLLVIVPRGSSNAGEPG